MNRAAHLVLIIAVILWGTLAGAVMYSHIVYFPPYLGHLPESTALITGPYGLHEERFWLMLHPVLIVTLIITATLNWRQHERRKYILITIGIYALAIIATTIYFVPELMDFAESHKSNVPAAEWLARGQRWQYLSWARGAFIYLGLVMLILALTKPHSRDHADVVRV